MELKEQIEQTIKKNFTISYADTDNNRLVKDTFITFCKHETDGSYLQGIKRLIENYSSDWKYEELRELIQSLRGEIENLKKQEVPEQKPKKKTFG